MVRPFKVGYYSGGTGHYNTYKLPQDRGRGGDGGVINPTQDISTRVSVNPTQDITTRVSKKLRKYERLLEKNENRRYPTEFDLLNLGNHIIDYVPEKMSRFENVLDELSNKTEIRVDWVRRLLYEKLELEGRITKKSEEELFPLGVGALL